MSLFQKVETGSKTHAASYSLGNCSCLLDKGVKLAFHLYLMPGSRIVDLHLHSFLSYIFMA
jgi:hypothetical protein